MGKKKKILYISSLNPLIGPGAIAMDHYKALIQGGFEVDFLTLNRVEGYPEIKYIYETKPPKWTNFKFKLFRKFGKYDRVTPHGLFYLKETAPPVSFNKIRKRISRTYDMIIIFFWQELLSYKSVLDIYNYIGSEPKVLFLSADYSPMTGGCHFFGDCNRYATGCGNCPMLLSINKNDFTAWNNIYRQKVIEKIRPYIGVNTYMKGFFEKSSVVKSGATLVPISMTMDLNKFKPQDIKLARHKYDVPETIDFIILFGCQNLNDSRKGMKYLVEALNYFYDKLSPEEASKILLVSIGKDSDELSKSLKFQRKHLGYVEFKELPFIYSLANVFLSPSVNDAGPSMVNQAIACGTPVIAFEMGTALDVVKDRGTGFVVPLKDTKAFSDAVYGVYHLDKKTYEHMRLQCRQIAEQYQSYQSLCKYVNYIFLNGA